MRNTLALLLLALNVSVIAGVDLTWDSAGDNKKYLFFAPLKSQQTPIYNTESNDTKKALPSTEKSPIFKTTHSPTDAN